MAAYFYRREIIDPDILANPSVIANLEQPGKLDPYSRFDNHALSNLSPKKP